MCHFDTSSFHLPCLQDSNIVQVSVFPDSIEAGAVLARVQVVVADDQGFRIAPVQVFQQSPECSLLRLGARVGGLASDIQPALVADAYRVGVVVPAVGTGHVLRTASLDLSVTTDDVVIADAEVEAPLAVPGVDLGGRTRLAGPHCRTMNYYQCYLTHDCTKKVDTTSDAPLNYQTFWKCMG